MPEEGKASEQPYNPPVAAASDEGQQAIGTFRVPQDLKLELFAAEPMLANAVAMSVDHHGHVYVAETWRIQKGAEDNRQHMVWLDDDLAARTVEDRLAYYKKHLGADVAKYATDHERVRKIVDRDGDGKADEATVFADGFNDILDGVAAGVLSYRGDVFFTCIPSLWRLRDRDGDGRADQRDSMHRGFGVHTTLMGHDLHGLIVGPDGRLYFSVGDRGHHVDLPGRTLENVHSGTVFRCELDGSNLEEVATGLRNPQKLAFDEYGNLFTADNNSDFGDKARWVYIVDGSDSGWRLSYQYFADRGPWNRERLWEPHFAGQAAYIVPTVGNMSDGPSGLAYYPGVGWPEKYRGCFFLADFRGTGAISGIRMIRHKPSGAGFELVESGEFLWSILATDVDFGPDCALYISDWIEGWGGTGKGRVYRLFNPATVDDPAVLEVKGLLNEGLAKQSNEQLVKLLGHADQRVRQEAQFELVARRATTELRRAAANAKSSQLARIHAIWALGQLARQGVTDYDAYALAERLLDDPDPEIRAQTARIIGDAAAHPEALRLVLPLLADESPRVRHLAAIAMSKSGDSTHFPGTVEMLRDNNDREPILRHSGVMALAAMGDADRRLPTIADDPSAAVRMAALLAWRRLKSPQVARFLNDADPLVVLEAARAIHDMPIPEAMPQLAALISHPYKGDADQTDALMRRVLNANFRLGAAEHAAAIAEFAATNPCDSETLVIEAVEMLGDWLKPSNRDRLLGLWRPLEPRDGAIAVAAMRPVLSQLLEQADAVQQAVVSVIGKLEVREAGPALLKLIADASRPAALRVAALETLSQLRDEQLSAAIDQAIHDGEPLVRAAGRKLLVKLRPDDALPQLREALERGAAVERQSALAALKELNNAGATAAVEAAMDQLLSGQMPLELHLDLLDAAAQLATPKLQKQLEQLEATRPKDDPLAEYRETLAGGDAIRGRGVFFARTELSCRRCHKVGRAGGEVGPDLTDIAAKLTSQFASDSAEAADSGNSSDPPDLRVRQYLLESVVAPNKTITKGYGTVVVVTDDGLQRSGIVSSEDDTSLRLMTVEGKLIAVPKNTIEQRTTGLSAMPNDLVKQITKRDLRDLVEFLANLKGGPPPGAR